MGVTEITVQEIVKLNPKAVRSDEKLMRLYIEMYTGVFGKEPNCAGCTFKTDFNKLKKAVLTGTTTKPRAKNLDTMASKKYVLKREHANEILTYRKKKVNRPVRTYGYGLTDEYAENFLKHGTKAQIAERKKMFLVINDEPQGKAGKKYVAEQEAKDATKAATKKAQDATMAKVQKSEEELAKEQEALKAANVQKQAQGSKGADAPPADAPPADAPPADAPPADAPPADAPPADAPVPGTPMYNAQVIKFMGQAKVDELLADNMLNPESYKTLKEGKAALSALKN